MKTIKIILLSLLAILLIPLLHFLLFWIVMGLSNYFDAFDEGMPVGKEYYIYPYKGKNLINHKKGGILIDTDVVTWDFDSTHIIAKQKPFRDIMDTMQETNYEKKRRIYKKSNIYHYWIIDKREELESYYDETIKKRVYTKGLYGPFTREEYWEKRRELGVQDSLRLRETRWRGRPLVRTQQAVIE